MTVVDVEGPKIVCEPMMGPLVTWADVRARMPEIRWLWEPWLPEGHVVMVAGEVGTGKSALAMRIAMTVTLGLDWPDGSPAPAERGHVLWCEAEAAQVINFSRARQWGGDAFLQRLATLTDDPFAECRLDDPAHLARIRETALNPTVRLIVVDSLRGAHRGDENSAESASIVKTLATIAQETGKPILLTHHLRKRGMNDTHQGVALDRIRGSSALTQYTRVVWALDTPHPQDREHKRLAVIKSNLGPYPADLGMTVGEGGVAFTEPVAAEPSPAQRTKAVDEAEAFLLTYLGNGQRVTTRLIEEHSAAQGISRSSLRRARKSLGVAVSNEGEQWCCFLPKAGGE